MEFRSADSKDHRDRNNDLAALSCGISKSRTRHSRVNISPVSQEKLLDAVASTDTGMRVDNAEEWEDVLNHQVQSFRQATETNPQGVEISTATRCPCSPGKGNSTRHLRSIRCLRREPV